jgi:hypothetical protein
MLDERSVGIAAGPVIGPVTPRFLYPRCFSCLSGVSEDDLESLKPLLFTYGGTPKGQEQDTDQNTKGSDGRVVVDSQPSDEHDRQRSQVEPPLLCRFEL